MTKKRSPYEVEHVSTALGLRQSGVSSVGKAASLKKQKSAVPSSSFLLPDDVDGRTISRNNSEHGAVLVTDAERDVMNAVDAKLAALAAAGGTASPLKTQGQKYATGVNGAVSGYATPDHRHQTQPMSVETLEEKRILLPYLDKIEYINYQLRMRGLLMPDASASVTHQQGNNDSAAYFPKSVAIRDTSVTVVSGKTPTKPLHNSSPVTVNQATIGRNQEVEQGNQQAAKKAKLSTDLLRARYPRLVETIGDSARLAPRLRPITWLLKLVEDIYDAFFSDVISSSASTGNAKVDAETVSPRPESTTIEKSSSQASVANNSRSAKRKAPGTSLALPAFTRRFLQHSLGLPTLADQDCLDLVYNVEVARERFPEAALFSRFLRELFDSDALTFFLVVRDVAQKELELQLCSKEKQARTSSAKKYIPGNLFEVVSHPLIPDGTKQILLAGDGCESVLKRLLSYTIELRQSVIVPPIATPIVLAHYVVNEKMKTLFSGSGKPLIPVEDFLSYMVETFREISEDIIAQFKYNDDGESLTNLIRLRDTISCDSKIDKMVVSYADHERSLRTMKIELMKMERTNSGNRFRTQICLMQNRIRLQEQELQHIQSEISSTESRVNDVWKAVVQPHAKNGTKRHSLSNSNSLGAKSSSTVELSSILGRFECFIARLQRKHDIEVKASALLARPWEEQMEELKLRMVVRIQRAYRARKKIRDTKEQARAKLRDQIRERDMRLKNEQIDQKRLQALHEKDMQRHQARLQLKKAQEEQTKAELEAKQRDLIRKLRDEEISQRNAKRNRQQQAYTLRKWTDFVQRRYKKRQANKVFMKFKFLNWKTHFSAYKNCVRAAMRIQRFARARQERERFRRVLNLRVKRSKIARKYLQKVQMRQLNTHFNQWCRFTVSNQNLKANFQSIIHKRTGNWFQQWVGFIVLLKAKKIDAAKFIQRVYRGRVARQVFRVQRIRHSSALIIQRIYRGYRCRVAVALLRKLRHHQDLQCRGLLQRIKYRQLLLCFSMLAWYRSLEREIKKRAYARLLACQLRAFREWIRFTRRKQGERAAFYRKQYNSAILIQRNYRRHRCQIVFRESIVRHRAAITIQRCFRGFRGRERAKKCRWERNAAISLQRAWRKRRAKQLTASIRTEKILLGAFKGDYSSTKRAIASGYWCVVDQEGNGIFHMAAAAGHKRLIKLCLRNRMDINITNRRGQTPLHLLLANLPPYASINDLTEDRVEKVALAAYMIDHGAWHEASDEDGFTPLLLCSALGQTEAVEMLLEREANTDARSTSGGLNAAQLAVEGNHWATLQALLDSRGFDYDQNVHDTVRLLHACAGRGLIDCLRVLIGHIQQRFDTFPENVLDTPDEEGYTPLIYAITNGFVDIVQCLLESNAGPDVKDFFGRSPLHFAVSNDDPVRSEAIVKSLTMYEADVNVKDNDGDAPLHLSCDHDDRLACTSLLLASGAMICSNALGNHPTHIAARHGAIATLKLLVHYGGDMNLKNYEGKTPLGMARMFDQKAVVQHIERYFAQEAIAPEDNDKVAIGLPAELHLDTAHDTETIAIDDEKHSLGDQEPENAGVENSFLLAEMSSSDWDAVLVSGYWMGEIAEWTQYIDIKSGMPFYCCRQSGSTAASDGRPICTWDPPVEFEASIGEDWEIVRSNKASSFSPRSAADNISTPDGSGDDCSSGSMKALLAKHSVQYLYHNKVTGEYRAAVPPINLSLLQDVVQNSKRQKMLRARVHKVSLTADDTSASVMEYMRFFHAFEDESAQMRAEIHAAIKIQRHFRAKRTHRLVKTLLHENRCALYLQRAFRGRKARRIAVFKRKEHGDATKIQSLWRGYWTRKQEQQLGLHAQRKAHVRCRLAALQIQRVFRGWCDRKAVYREKVVHTLGPRGYFAWELVRQRALVVRSFKVWDEMRCAPQDFPGVLFYCHQITRACNWDKPKEWAVEDRAAFEHRCELYRWGYTQPMQHATVRLQRLWRARAARISFQFILKSVHLMQTCEQDYLEEPTNLVKMGNYVLYLHTITHDYERARPLYGRLMRMMAQRGPDVSFILLSYGIFLYVTQEEDPGLVEDMILRGKLQDPQLIKYKMAYWGFFRQAVVQNPLDAESNLNYAACVQWLYGHYEDATTYYLRAIAANPHKTGSMAVFQDMLDRKWRADAIKRKNEVYEQEQERRQQRANPKVNAGRVPALPPLSKKVNEDELRAQYDAFEVFRRWQQKQAEADDIKRRHALEAEREAADHLAAAKKIQSRYRRRAAMRQVNRVKREKQLAASIAELAAQKVVYDKVIAAFDQLGSASSRSASKTVAASASPSTMNNNRPLSVPITQLHALLQGMQIGLSDAEIQDVAAQFHATNPTLRHVNVLDVCQFVEKTPALRAKATTC